MKMKITPRTVAIAVVVGAAALVVLANRFLGAGTGGVIVTRPTQAASSITASQAGAGPASGSPTPPASTIPVEPGPTDDGVSSDPPIIVRPAEQPDVRETATAFTAAWLNTSHRSPGVWRAALTDRVTADLAEDLSYADPDSVPAGKVGNPVEVTPEGSLFDAAAPVVEATPGGKTIGVLHLTLIRDGRDWLISEIDWEPAR